MNNDRMRVCPVERAGSLDSRMRSWLQNPRRILAPYVKPGMTVLDVGCGPGFFTIPIATMVGNTGKVIAADLQEGMLEKLRSKIKGTALEGRMKLVKCDEDRINVSDRVDFVLTFYMVHEVPDKNSFFKQLREVLNSDGQYLLVEPKLFHVSQSEFEGTLELARKNGFVVHPGPKLLLSWSAILMKA